MLSASVWLSCTNYVVAWAAELPPLSPEFSQAATLKSSVVNDHFNVIFGREVIDREFPKGKRCFPKSGAGGGHGRRRPGSPSSARSYRSHGPDRCRPWSC